MAQDPQATVPGLPAGWRVIAHPTATQAPQAPPVVGQPPPRFPLAQAAGVPPSGQTMEPPKVGSGPPLDPRNFSPLPPPAVTLPGDVTPGQVKNVTTVAGPVLGSVVGGMLGARGGPMAAMEGSTIGSGAGELAAMGVETATGTPPTPEELIKRTGSGMIEGATAEVGGQIAGKVLKTVAAPFASRVSPRGLAAEAALGAENITPGSIVKSPVMDFMENVAQYGLTGESKMQAARERTQASIDRYATGLLDQFGPKAKAPQAAGADLSAVVSQIEKDTSADLSQRYTDLWKAAEDRGVTTLDTSKLIARAQELSGQVGQVGKQSGALGTATGSVRALEAAGEQGAPQVAGLDTLQKVVAAMDPADPRRAQLVQEINEATAGITDPSTMTPAQVHRLRSLYGRAAALRKGKPDAGEFAQLAKAADETLNQLPKDLRDQYTTLTSDYKEYAETFKRGALEKFLKANAKDESYLRTLIKPHDVETVSLLKDVLKDTPEDFRKLQRGFAESLLDDGKGGIVSPAILAKKLGSKGYGPEVIQEMFPKGTSDGFFQLQRILEDTVGRKAAGTGRMWIQLATPGAAAGTVGLLTGDWKKATLAGGAVLLTPAILAHILTNPAAKTWLTTGLKASKYIGEDGVATTSNAATSALLAASQRAIANLTTWLVREQLIHPAGPRAASPAPPLEPRDTASGRSTGAGPRAGGPPPSTSPRASGGASGGAVTPPPHSFLQSMEGLGALPTGTMQAIGQPPPPVVKK